MKEFVKFGKLAPLVQKIVNDDDVGLLTQLYKSKDVKFIPSFLDALNWARSESQHRNVVVATHLTLIHYESREQQTHAVSLWFAKNGYKFLWDPNGEINDDGVWEVQHFQNYAKMRKLFGFETSMGQGPQTRCPHTPGYIHFGAYCEFYNVLMMELWLESTKPMETFLQTKHPELWHVDMAKYSLHLMRKVFTK